MRLIACGWALVASFSGLSADLSLHGSNTVGADLAPALVREWLAATGHTVSDDLNSDPLEVHYEAHGSSQLSVRLEGHGSGTGFRGVLSGEADIAMSSRPIVAAEAAELDKVGGFDPIRNEYVVALDGIAVIVHPDNPVSGLSRQRLQEVFSGSREDWSALGWPAGGKISVYARDDASGTFDTFASLVLRDAGLVPTARRYESNDQLSDDVARDRLGIGFVSLPAIRSAKALTVHEEGTRPLVPSRFTVATEDYALSRRLYFYVPASRLTPRVESFIRFALSDAGQQVVRRVGFVAQHLEALPASIPDEAPREYASLVSGASRLNVNIRFRPGATSLDSKALRDLDRIVEHIGQAGNRRLMLMGFTDALEAPPAFADELAMVRADYIASELTRRGVPPTRVRGFGQDLPVAANNTERGRQKNRRVEVWVYDDREFRPPLGGTLGR